MSETISSGVTVERLEIAAYTVPTDSQESDGTLTWDSTTMILVEASGGGKKGLGYTYGDVSVGKMIESKFVDLVEGTDALSPPTGWAAMQSAIHDAAPVYGSGGFTSYSLERLQEQLGGWAEDGIPRVKMKVGREPEKDPQRVRAAREAIGDSVELLVDANGAYARKQALYWAQRFAEAGIVYLEEPVTSEDREGLRLLRDRGPGGLAIAAGEYEWTLPGLADLAGCVDVLQADVTRCGGITNLLRVDGICEGRQIPFSAHCAPAVSAHACCALESLLHLEYFHDHVRVEGMLFDGVLKPEEGYLRPDRERPGLGLELKRADAERYAA